MVHTKETLKKGTPDSGKPPLAYNLTGIDFRPTYFDASVLKPEHSCVTHHMGRIT